MSRQGLEEFWGHQGIHRACADALAMTEAAHRTRGMVDHDLSDKPHLWPMTCTNLLYCNDSCCTVMTRVLHGLYHWE